MGAAVKMPEDPVQHQFAIISPAATMTAAKALCAMVLQLRIATRPMAMKPHLSCAAGPAKKIRPTRTVEPTRNMKMPGARPQKGRGETAKP